MPIKSLEEIGMIGEFSVVHEVGADKKSFQQPPVAIDHENNTITFKLQDGPIKEVGVNGCQVDTIIEAAMMMIQGLDEKVECFQNQLVVNRLEDALLHLEWRRKDRQERGVEGTMKA